MYFITNLIFCLTLFHSLINSSFSYNDVIDYNCNLTNYSQLKFCNEAKLLTNYSNLYCLDYPLKNDTNCLNNTFSVYHIGKKGKLSKGKYKIKKSKGVKLYKNVNEYENANENEYENVNSGSGDIDLTRKSKKSKKEKKDKAKKSKKGKVKKDKKLKKYYHLGYKNESNDNKNYSIKDKKNNDVTNKVVIITSSLLFITILFGSLFYAIKYRNKNRNVINPNNLPQNEKELLIPKRDYQEI